MDINYSGKLLLMDPIVGLIRQGEKLADNPVFHLPKIRDGIDQTALTWVIRATTPHDTLAQKTLSVDVSGTDIKLPWIVEGDFTSVPGAMSITLVGTSSDGSIIVKYVGDKNLYVNPAESGQYDPPADLLEGALKYGASAESNAKAAAAAATSAAGSAAAAETNATNAAASATAAAQSAATIDVEQLKSQIMLLAHPVGSIYESTDSTSPATLFGGTWTQIKDRFLLAAGDIYTVGATGGEATHALTASEMPAHSHGPKVNGERFACHAGTATVTGLGFSAGSNVDLTWETASVGGGAAHNNMPPYLTVYVWQRTA